MTTVERSSTPIRKPLALAVRLGAVALIGALVWVNLQKTLWVGIQGWGRPYWWLDYHHGFVRRGLVGEIFQALAGRLSETQLIVPVDRIHRACLLLLCAATLIQVYAALRAQKSWRPAALVMAVTTWAAASQFWPTIAYNQGYLDAVVLALAANAALLMRARLYWVVGACLIVGPFIHEYFCFLIPFILASGRIEPEAPMEISGDIVGFEVDAPRSDIPRHLLWLGGVAFLTAAVVMLLPTAAAVRSEIGAMPLNPEDRKVLTEVTLTQTLQQSLSTNLGLFFQDPPFTFSNMLFFAGPGFLAVTGLLLWPGRRPNRALWLRAAAALFPIGALALAWDLSRLLVMADFTALMLFLMTTQDLAPREARLGGAWRWAPPAAAAGVSLAALAYLMLPMAYVYYPPGPATLYPLTDRFGFEPHTFGAERLWPIVKLASPSLSLPADQKRLGPQLLRDLQPVSGLSRPGLWGEWKVAAHTTERLVLFGPYIDLPEGWYAVTYRVRLQHPVRSCVAPVAMIDGRSMTEPKPQASPVRVQGETDCAWRLSAKLVVPKGGAKGVETHLYLSAGAALVVDRYSLVRSEPAVHSL